MKHFNHLQSFNYDKAHKSLFFFFYNNFQVMCVGQGQYFFQIQYFMHFYSFMYLPMLMHLYDIHAPPFIQ